MITDNARIAAIALALAGCTNAAGAFANEAARSETVRFEDLDLTHPAGVARLDRRLANAVSRVCGQAPRSLSGYRKHKACAAEIWAQIDPQRSYFIARANRGASELALQASSPEIRVASAD